VLQQLSRSDGLSLDSVCTVKLTFEARPPDHHLLIYFLLAFFKSSIIGGRWAEDEVGSAARERPQMKSVNGMYIITTSTNHNGHQLPIDVSIIANHLHSYM
jgi:hypothetical protein